MLINGEKYACEACVRGHRVSNCHHSERQLQHIAKKGRPVSQCAHCRTLRKSRSAHVKCDCGDKSHSKASCNKGTEGDSKDTCCCSHGGRCSCALKKEYLQAVPESESDEGSKSTSSNSSRPRAQTHQSENSALTVFTNGHHKPAHKHNLAHRKQGHPYVVPRHPLHGASASGLANRSVDNLAQLSSVDVLHNGSQIKDSIVSAQQEQRQVRSEHASPLLPSSNLEQLHTQLPPPDINGFDFNAPLSADPFNFFTEHQDMDQSVFSAGFAATPIDWSHYPGLDFNSDSNHTNSNFAISNYSQAPSFSGFDYNKMEPQPALTTTSTSGDVSEVEDGLYLGCPSYQKQDSDYSDWNMPQNYTPPMSQPLSSGSGIDLDELLRAESESQNFVFNTAIAATYGEPEKHNPQTYDHTNSGFTIPVDETESGWYDWGNQPDLSRQNGSGVPLENPWL